MKVYTYFEHINLYARRFSNYQDELLKLWKISWKQRGFEPTVLNLDHAKQHEYYIEYIERLETLHLDILNTPLTKYGLSCYLRWLAYATVKTECPFYVMDYDIINTGLDIIELENIDSQLHLMSWCCPCFASGTPKQFEDLCRKFIYISNDNIEKSRQLHKKLPVGNCYHDNEFFIFHKNLLDKEIKFTKSEKVPAFERHKDMNNKAVHVSHFRAKQDCLKQSHSCDQLKTEEHRIQIIKELLNF